MKFKKLAALTLAGAMSLSLAACGGGGSGSVPAPPPAAPPVPTPAPAPEGEVYKIGVLAPEVTHGWSAGVAYYAEQRCEELVAEGKIEKKILISGDAAEMTTQLDELKTWGADAIVAFQWEGMEVPIQQAIDEGITVVNFDIAIDADGVYRVSGDNYDMGYQSAQYIVDKIGFPEAPCHPWTMPYPPAHGPSCASEATEHMAEIAPDMELIEYATKFTREAGLADMARHSDRQFHRRRLLHGR